MSNYRKDPLSHLATYLFALMEEGVQPDQFAERLDSDIGKIMQDDKLITMTVLAQQLSL